MLAWILFTISIKQVLLWSWRWEALLETQLHSISRDYTNNPGTFVKAVITPRRLENPGFCAVISSDISLHGVREHSNNSETPLPHNIHRFFRKQILNIFDIVLLYPAEEGVTFWCMQSLFRKLAKMQISELYSYKFWFSRPREGLGYKFSTSIPDDPIESVPWTIFGETLP